MSQEITVGDFRHYHPKKTKKTAKKRKSNFIVREVTF